MRHIRVACALSCLAAAPAAQQSVLFCMDADETTIDNAGGLVEAGTILQDEVAIVTPELGSYSASIFLSYNAQWGYLGDFDGDGTFVDSSSDGPGADTDAIFVKRFPSSPFPVTPRDVYLSKEDVTNLGAGFEDGDVYRYSAQGAIEFFLTEDHLDDAFASTGTKDLNGICQSDTGDLFLTFSDATVATGEDGSVFHVPASAITYDLDGNVTAITSGAAHEIATELDMIAFMFASGMKTSVGGDPSTSSFDVSGLEIDPAGGTWTSLVDGLEYPNLLFAWQGFSNDGAILSTAGGGSIPSVNGVPLASASATTGLQIGVLPDTTGLGGLMGLAVAEIGPRPVVVENYPSSLITTSTILFTRQEASNCTPLGPVVFFIDMVSNAPGTAAPAISFPGFGGELYGDGLGIVVLATTMADAGGYASQSLLMPQILWGSNLHFVFQALDLTSGTFGTPAPMDFL